MSICLSTMTTQMTQKNRAQIARKDNAQTDFIVEDKILVEVKKTGRLTKIDEMQMINYLKATNLKIGLILNFGRASLQWKRIIY